MGAHTLGRGDSGKSMNVGERLFAALQEEGRGGVQGSVDASRAVGSQPYWLSEEAVAIF